MDEQSQIGVLVEKYRYFIGGSLLVLILAGGVFLLWRENYFKPEMEGRIMKQETRIKTLETEVKSLKESRQITGNNTQASADNQSPSAQAEQGQVAGASASSQSPAKSASQPVSGKINLNTATLAQLDSLPGIGQTYAQRIVEYRDSHGGFKTIEEIKNVKGIGDKTFEKFKDKITVN